MCWEVWVGGVMLRWGGVIWGSRGCCLFKGAATPGMYALLRRDVLTWGVLSWGVLGAC